MSKKNLIILGVILVIDLSVFGLGLLYKFLNVDAKDRLRDYKYIEAISVGRQQELLKQLELAEDSVDYCCNAATNAK